MDIVTADFETFYDTDYSLSKMTTESYIRDPRFEVIGVAIKVNGLETDWYSGDNFGRFLGSIRWDNKAALAHNAAFDGAILGWHFGIHPKMWLDTMSMARPKHANGCGVSLKALAKHYGLQAKGDEVIRALGKRRKDFSNSELAAYGDYCVGDADITYELFKCLVQGFPAEELQTISTTIKMFTEPTLVLDKPRLEAHLLAERERKARLMEKLGGDRFRPILNSNPKLAVLLEQLGVDVPLKTSKSTGNPTYAFAKNDRDFLALLEHEDFRVRTVVEARLGTKSSIEETRTESFLGISDRGTLPIMLNYWGAHTGRFSGGDKINLQNIPRGGELRKSIKAPPGKKLITCDLSQIEARILAVIAGQADLVHTFAIGGDPYCEFASKVYGRSITKADKVERFVGKTATLGLGYALGWEKFRATLAIGQGGIKVNLTADQARNIVETYRQTNAHIKAFWKRCDLMIGDMYRGGSGDLIPGVVSYDQYGLTLPNGMRINYQKLDAVHGKYKYVGDMRQYNRNPENGWKHIYGGSVTENVTQALARIVIVEMMNKIAKRYRVVLQVHDEIVILVDDDEEEVSRARAFVEKIMRTPPVWLPSLPVNCESGEGYSYGESK